MLLEAIMPTRPRSHAAAVVASRGANHSMGGRGTHNRKHPTSSSSSSSPPPASAARFQFQQQRSVQAGLSSEASVDVSSPSVFFESEAGDSSSISFVSSCSSLSMPAAGTQANALHTKSTTLDAAGEAAPLSELYYNPYEPLSYVRNAALNRNPSRNHHQPPHRSIMDGDDDGDAKGGGDVVTSSAAPSAARSPTSVMMQDFVTVASTATTEDTSRSSSLLPVVLPLTERGARTRTSRRDRAELSATPGVVVTKTTEDRCEGGQHQTTTPLVNTARLQELEQKRQALRHQRFTLEQRLYHFCGRQQKPQPKPREEGGTAAARNAAAADETRTAAVAGKPGRSGTTPTPTQADNKGGSQPADDGGRTVVDWAYATTTLSTGRDGERRKKRLQVVYTGRLNLQGQPHDDEAVLRFSDGQTYEGGVRCGLRSGTGINRWQDGQRYEGEWAHNSRNGRGTHVWKDGRSVTGDWKDGHLHGKIYFMWPNGAIFDGSAKMGKKDGRGVHTWADGTVYNGHFQNGKEHGFGTLTLPDGVKYRGQFRSGMKEGFGIMLWKTRTYDGEWVQNKPHGQGRVVWSNGAVYTGQFKEGKYHGLGVYIWPSGKKFVGRWELGVKNGHGLYTWPNGKKYDGEYADGLKEGYGRMTWPDGSTYNGGFRSNKRWGRGVQTDLDGVVVHCGLWENDLPFEEGKGNREADGTIQGNPGPVDAAQHPQIERTVPVPVMTEEELAPTTPTKDDERWSAVTPSPRKGGGCLAPRHTSSTHSPVATVVIAVTPEEKRDISSPMSTADDDDDDGDDESSGGDVMSPNEFSFRQSSTAAMVR